MKANLSELVLALSQSKREDIERIKQIIAKRGNISEDLSRLSGNSVYWEGVIDDTVNSQFPDKNRPLIEIVANSVDALQGRYQKDVSVHTTGGGFRVEDYGIGMNLDDILVKLLIPTISGKEGQNTVGRFGVGFYSILSYLSGEGDSVLVQTSDGPDSYSVEFSKNSDQIFVDINPIEAMAQGTTVSANIEDFDSANAQSLLTSTMSYNPNANILLQGKRINGLEGFTQVVDGDAEVKILYSDSRSEGNGRISASVNGVTIFSLETLGQNLPSDVVIDYPVTTTLPIARNILEVDAQTVDATKQLIDIAGIQLNNYQLFNALYPIVKRLQDRNYTVEGEHNLVGYIKQKVKHSLEEGRIYLPDLPDFRKLAIDDAVFVHPDLIAEETQRFDFEKYKGFSSQNAVYLVDFQDDTVMLHHDHYVLLNRRFAPTTALEKAALQEYMKLEGVTGKFSEPVKTARLQQAREDQGGSIRDRLFSRFFDELWGMDYKREFEDRPSYDHRIGDKDFQRMMITVKDRLSREDMQQYLSERVFADSNEIVTSLTTIPFAETYLRTLEFDEQSDHSFRCSSVQFNREIDKHAMIHMHEKMQRERVDGGSLKITSLDTNSETFLKDYANILRKVLDGNHTGIDTDSVLREYILCQTLAENKGFFENIQIMDEDNLRVFDRYYAQLHNPDEDSWQDQVDLRTIGDFPILDASFFTDERKTRSLDSLFDILSDTKVSAVLESSFYRNYNLLNKVGTKLIDLDPELFDHFSEKYFELIQVGSKDQFLDDLSSILFGNQWGSDFHFERYHQDRRVMNQLIGLMADYQIYLSTENIHLDSIQDPKSVFKYLSRMHTCLDETLDMFEEKPNSFFMDYLFFVNRVTSLHTALPELYCEDYLEADTAEKINNVWRDVLKKDYNSYKKVVDAFKSLKPYESSIKEIPRSIRPYLFYFQQDKAEEIVSLDQATSIEAGNYSHNIRLSSLFNGFLNNSEPIEVNSSLACLDSLIATEFTPQGRKYTQRAIQHAINNQSSDQYIFIRELIQNSIDEAVNSNAPAERRQVDINTYQRDGDLVLSVRDQFGMDLDTVVNYLLIPNNSTKKDNEEMIGHFGQGFFTCLKESKEVQIKTSRGDGQTTYVRMTPLRDHNGKIMDVDIAVDIQDEDYQGTEVQWAKQSDMKELEAAFIKSNVITYANLVDSEALQVNWHGSQLNRDKKLLSRKATGYGDISFYQLTGENTVTHRGLYLREIDNDYTQCMPGEVRDILLKHGIVIDLPKKLRLVKDRSDIASKQDYLAEIGSQITVASLESVVQLFSSGEVDLKCIPYDFVTECSRYDIDTDVQEDVQRIQADQTIALERYAESTNLAKLLVSIPFAETKEGKKSLAGCVRYLETGGSLDDLPENVTNYINQNRQKEQAVRESQKEKMKQGYVEFRDLQPPAQNPEMDAYWAFSDFTSAIGRKIFETEYDSRDIISTFYSVADGSKAHAYQQGNKIGWNALEMDSYMSQFARLLKGDLSEDEQTALLNGIVETVTHELVHIGEGTMEWTHNEDFTNKQKKLLANSIKISGQLQTEIDRVVGSYQGTYANGKTFCQYVSKN